MHLGANIEKLNNDLQGKTLSFRHENDNEGQSDATNDPKESEHRSEPYTLQHYGKGVRNDDISEPEGEGANGYTKAADPRGEDLGAEDVGYGPEAHDEAADVKGHTYSGDWCIDQSAKIYRRGENQKEERCN